MERRMAIWVLGVPCNRQSVRQMLSVVHRAGQATVVRPSSGAVQCACQLMQVLRLAAIIPCCLLLCERQLVRIQWPSKAG